MKAISALLVLAACASGRYIYNEPPAPLVWQSPLLEQPTFRKVTFYFPLEDGYARAFSETNGKSYSCQINPETVRRIEIGDNLSCYWRESK